MVIWWNGYHGYPLNTHGILILGMPLQVIGDPGQDFDFRSVSWWHRTNFRRAFQCGKCGCSIQTFFMWESLRFTWVQLLEKVDGLEIEDETKGPSKQTFQCPKMVHFVYQRASKHIKTTCHFSKLSGWSGTLAKQFFLVPESVEGKIHRKPFQEARIVGKKNSQWIL